VKFLLPLLLASLLSADKFVVSFIGDENNIICSKYTVVDGIITIKRKDMLFKVGMFDDFSSFTADNYKKYELISSNIFFIKKIKD